MPTSIPSRRLLLAAAGASLLPLGANAASLVPTPRQTEGPFYPTALPADMDNDLVQVRGQAARAMGTVLYLEGRVLGVDGRPVEGALVEIWQCDAQGVYDHPRQPGRDRRDSAFQAYGRLLVSADGRYSFRTLNLEAGFAPGSRTEALSRFSTISCHAACRAGGARRSRPLRKWRIASLRMR